MKGFAKILSLPAIFWLLIFVVGPLLFLCLYSFLERGIYGNIEYQFSLENYVRIFDILYLKAAWRTLENALLTTFCCFIFGFPLAYYISTRKQQGVKNALLILIIIPFWTNFLIRTYALMVVLSDDGPLNLLLLALGWIEEPKSLLFTPFAVRLGLFYNYLPFMVLPLYATLERLDKNLLLAAEDLGASIIQVFTKLILPLSKKGIFTGCLLVLIPSLGEFIIPDLLGGAKTLMLGNIIKDQFLSVRDIPFATAITMVLMAVILLVLMVLNRKIDETVA